MSDIYYVTNPDKSSPILWLCMCLLISSKNFLLRFEEQNLIERGNINDRKIYT